jgi:penicillin G amidase
MRVGLAGVCLVGLLAVGCNGKTKAPPSLTLSPSGTVNVLGPKTFQAVAVNTGGPVTWSLVGVGTLSATSGERVVYRPPAAMAAGAMVKLTAASGGLTAVANLQLSPPALAAGKIPGLTANVEVRYDEWEIPHIKCAQKNDCFTVQGYLHAQDRLFQMDFFRRVATGTLATLLGPPGLSQDVQLRTFFTTRSGKRLGDELARNLLANDPATATTVNAYVKGINARLADLRAAGTAPLGDEYAQLLFPITANDVPDWTLADVTSFMRLQQFQLSETLGEELDYGRFAAVYGADPKLGVYPRTAQPSSEQTFTLQPTNSPTPIALMAAMSPSAVMAAWKGSLDTSAASMVGVRQLLRPLDGSTGSNNWVVDGAHSATGFAMVANDPHLSLRYPPNFHLSTLTSTNAADNLDVTGGAFPGVPGAQVGRGKHVGWGVTVVGYDVTDVYLEQAVPTGMCPAGAPLNTAFCVSYKGATAAVLAYPVTFQVRTAAGLIDAQGLPAGQRPPAVVAVVPHHGPVIQAPDGAGKAVSFRWTGHEDNTNDLKAFLGLNTATNVADAMAALKHYATGAQNFVLADDTGAIAYDPHALVPVRPWASGVAMATGTPTPHAPWFPLPGDGSAEWGPTDNTNCAAAGTATINATCWIADGQLPQGTSATPGYAGFYATSNADPVGTTASPYPIPIDANGNYLSFSWSDSSGFRHARVTERLQAATASGGKVSQADMESIQTDHVSRFGAAFQRQIAKLTPTAGTDLATAQALMAAWKTGGFDCPSGLKPGQIDPVLGEADPDPTVSTNSAACYLFHQFARNLLPAVFSDELAHTGAGMDGVMALKGMLYMLENPTAADQSFCNDVDSTGALVKAHTCVEQLASALTGAFESLAGRLGDPSAGDWVWGRVHTFQPGSEAAPLVSLGFQPGPFARPGGAFTVDVASPALSGTSTTFTFGSSGNVRHVSVMDPDATKAIVRMQLPGPEVSRPYGTTVGPDLLTDWARNVYFDYAHGDQIMGATASIQEFTP